MITYEFEEELQENLIVCGKCKRHNDFRDRQVTEFTYDEIKCRCGNIIYC